MLPAQIRPPPFLNTLWHWLTEPVSGLVQPVDRRNARLISALFLMSIVMLIVVRILRTALQVPESAFNINTFAVNILVMTLCYILSRTRYYRTGVIVGIAAVMSVIYIQAVYRAYTNPVHLTDSAVWAVGMVLIGGLVVSWQIMLVLAAAFVVGLALFPIIVPGLTIYDVRFSLEFIIGMVALITVTAILRQRDLQRISQQTVDLKTSEARYRTLLNAGFEAVVIHDNGHILDVNDTVLHMTGYTSVDQIIGKMTIDLLTPDARPAIAKLYAERPPDNLVYQTVIQHKDGRRIDAEIRSRTITYQGQVVRVVVMRDITQSKQASDQIKNLFNNLDRVFYSFSIVERKLLQISPTCEKILGYSQQALYDDISIWPNLVYPDDMPQFAEDMTQVTQDQHELRPFRIVRKDGTVRWVEMVTIPVFNAAGERTRFDGLITDITERRQIEAEQRELQAERERSLVLRQFITDASHDLRTPLATLYTSLYLLRRVSPPDENISRYLNTLETQTAHLNRVLDDLFTMSRLDSPESYVEKNRLDLNLVIDNVLSTQKSLAIKKQVQLHYFPSEAPVEVMADKEYLIMALTHVVNNAVQYTPGGGSVTIRVCAPNATDALIEVTDTGIGIQPSEIDLIFDRFYRSDRARKTDIGGVGLGLSLARKIVEVHDGTIEAESTPGQGSIFRIRLPLMLK